MNAAQIIAQKLRIRRNQVQSVIDLLDADNTVPFIARYRKEATDGLDDEQIQMIHAVLKKVRALDDRRTTILKAIEAQGKLTPKLKTALASAETLTQLEDLYAPYKKKRRTRAAIARENGLLPLARHIWRQTLADKSAHQTAADFINEQITSAEAALAGARDIVAEFIAESGDVRAALRRRASQNGLLLVKKIKKADDPKTIFKLYYNFSLPAKNLRPHQTLAINRGEKAKILRVKLQISDHDWLIPIRLIAKPNRRSPFASDLQVAINDAAKRLLLPAIERDIRRALTEKADSHAIQIFSRNLGELLSRPPLSGHVVIGIDPGFRSGCKVATVDATGKVLNHGTIYPHQPQKKHDDALKRLALLVRRYQATLIAIGNGTASRETEQLVAELTRQLPDLHYLITNEAGASVYSASDMARAELPDLDVSIRGAVSIARRVQDPLAELVKIDPKSIGVGLYQHDVNQKQLAEALDAVVERVVNRVGIDVNSASPALLAHVSGIGNSLAKKMVAHRDKNGAFGSRSQLLDVSGLGAKAFEQAAGFLRIRNGSQPLDNSAIHPESYAVATQLLQKVGIEVSAETDLKKVALSQLTTNTPIATLAAELGTGVPTLEDIIEQTTRLGRDPREDLAPPLLRKDILSMAQLKPGLRLHGTVRNIVDFGAFIDIGVKQDGLLHRSRLPRNTRLNVGDVIEVTITEVDSQRGRISLDWPKN